MTLQDAKSVADFVSITVVVSTLADVLPAIAAAVSIVWGLIRIYETQTVQNMLARWRR